MSDMSKARPCVERESFVPAGIDLYGSGPSLSEQLIFWCGVELAVKLRVVFHDDPCHYGTHVTAITIRG